MKSEDIREFQLELRLLCMKHKIPMKIFFKLLNLSQNELVDKKEKWYNMKIQYQNIATIELDTDTGKTRLISGWTKMLGKGNGSKNKKKPVKEIYATQGKTVML